MPNFNYEKKYWKENKIVAGVDEVGRGCLAGPVVSSAVILHSDCEKKSFLKLIDDSKKLTAKKREECFEYIISDFEYSYNFIDNNIIDEINILQASILSMKNSILELKSKPNHILIDGNRFTNFEIDYTLLIKGDSISYSISSASIIAKVLRDKYMVDEIHKKYPEYGFDSHKGYATQKHIQSIKKYGVTPYHRKTFLKNIFSNQQKMF